MSKKYIECEAAKEQIRARIIIGEPKTDVGLNLAVEAIDEAPAADVAEVRHGHWEFEVDDRLTWCTRAICSSCKQTVELTRELTQDWGKRIFLKDNLFCAKCGAKMDEGQKPPKEEI